VYAQNGFREKQAELEQAQAWALVETSESFQPMPEGEPDVWHNVWAYQVAANR